MTELKHKLKEKFKFIIQQSDKKYFIFKLL